jgi:hypothetical protein
MPDEPWFPLRSKQPLDSESQAWLPLARAIQETLEGPYREEWQLALAEYCEAMRAWALDGTKPDLAAVLERFKKRLADHRGSH